MARCQIATGRIPMTEWRMPCQGRRTPADRRKAKIASSVAKTHDPLHRAFLMQKNTSRARKVEWQLEYWEWLQIWQDSGHLHERGSKRGQWVMARNGDAGPYSTANVKIVRCQTNNSEGQIAKSRYRRLRAQS